MGHHVQLELDQKAREEHIAKVRKERREVRRKRDAQVAALYRHVRTFVLEHVEAVGTGKEAEAAVAKVPLTMTLVTPDLSDPERDHLFIGPFPVLKRDLHWNRDFEELDFTTSDGEEKITGTFRLTHSRTRAFGLLDMGGQALSVEYKVDPQRYRMRVAKDAAYLSGQEAQIKWDVKSTRWTGADWSKDYRSGFAFGVDGEKIVGDKWHYTFVASFDDIATGRKWQPIKDTYDGVLSKEAMLAYAVDEGTKPPSGEGAASFPYNLTVKLSEFGYDFEGGMVVKGRGYAGEVYGVIGDWAGAAIGGLYQLNHADKPGFVGVHGRTFFAGTTPAAHTEIDGHRLSWSGLPEHAAAEAGVPSSGYLVFSKDGAKIEESSLGVTGHRTRAHKALDALAGDGSGDLAKVLRHADQVGKNPDHELSALLRMSQFTVDAQGNYYDRIQRESMEDFYVILQNNMDADLRKTFFKADPPHMDQDLRDISKVKGTKGTDPLPWYTSLSVAYTSISLGKYSEDPFAKELNAARAETWISNQNSVSDVMAAQGPLMYQRRYLKKHENLDWFLLDQKNNAAAYAKDIDEKTAEWIAKMRESNVGTPEELAKMEKQITDLAALAKEKKLFWAFTVYAYTMTPSYLNMLKIIMTSGVDYDGSEFSQRVQRTVALLNVLDTSSAFSKEYTYTLQMFQFGTILPQLVDFSGRIEDFNLVVKDIIDAFIAKYLNNPDPALKEAIEALQKINSQELIGKLLAVLRTGAAVGYGLFNWSFLVQRFTSDCAKLFAGLPALVIRLLPVAVAGGMLYFFLTGQAAWKDLSDTQKNFIIFGGVNVIAVNVIALVKRGIAIHAIWDPAAGFWDKFKMFVSSDTITKAQAAVQGGLRGYILGEAGPAVPGYKQGFRQWWTTRHQRAQLLPRSGFVQKLFGKNLGQFMARFMTAAFAIIGIVMSSIDLHNSNTPMEKAANSLFIIAASLELIAAIGGWALAGSTLAVGGMLVTTIFSVVAVVGFLAFVAGAILLIVFMTQPQQSPVEKFAKDRSGDFYMPYKAAIESFRLYQPLSQPQRSGIALFADGDHNRAVKIGSDGRVSQAAFDSTGHTAFYLKTDERGRVMFGAPINDEKDKAALLTLGADESGALIARNNDNDDELVDPKLMWYADIQGEGTYEETDQKVKELKYAPFKLRSAYWQDDKKSARYLAVDGTGGWKLTADPAAATVIRLELMATKPAELSMNDISWLTIAHDEHAGPALQVPGSFPHEWAISPALPEGLTFDSKVGRIAMVAGADVPPAAKKEYQLSVSNALGSLSTKFTLEVKEPEEFLRAVL